MEIRCRDCATVFEFSDGEAKFYQEKNYSVPVRCKPCREVQKAKRLGAQTQSVVAPQAPVYTQESQPLPSRKKVVVIEEERRPPRKERQRRDTRIRPDDDY